MIEIEHKMKICPLYVFQNSYGDLFLKIDNKNSSCVEIRESSSVMLK